MVVFMGLGPLMGNGKARNTGEVERAFSVFTIPRVSRVLGGGSGAGVANRGDILMVAR
jgi:hypothetical protein